MTKPLHWDVHGQLYVLGVDDDQVNLMVVEQLLGSEGYKVTSVTDGSEALHALEEGSTWPDIIFLDYYLREGETGEEVCRQMREIFKGVNIPIVLCTALGDGAAAIQQALLAGATDYLLKPYERNKLLDKIKKHAPGKLATKSPAAPAPVEEPPPGPGVPSVLDFCRALDLEYCGMKLMDAGVSVEELKQMADGQLRKAGIVVKAQRDKILQAAAAI